MDLAIQTFVDAVSVGGLYARYWNRQSGGFLNLEAEAAE